MPKKQIKPASVIWEEDSIQDAHEQRREERRRRWSLDVLKENFNSHVPEWIKGETRVTDLPFPPALVSGVSEEDVAFLQETFALHPKDGA